MRLRITHLTPPRLRSTQIYKKDKNYTIEIFLNV